MFIFKVFNYMLNVEAKHLQKNRYEYSYSHKLMSHNLAIYVDCR